MFGRVRKRCKIQMSKIELIEGSQKTRRTIDAGGRPRLVARMSDTVNYLHGALHPFGSKTLFVLGSLGPRRLTAGWIGCRK